MKKPKMIDLGGNGGLWAQGEYQQDKIIFMENQSLLILSKYLIAAISLRCSSHRLTFSYPEHTRKFLGSGDNCRRWQDNDHKAGSYQCSLDTCPIICGILIFRNNTKCRPSRLCCACSKNEAGSGPLLPNLENGIRGITMPVITEAIVKEIGAEKIFTIDEALEDRGRDYLCPECRQRVRPHRESKGSINQSKCNSSV
jgi:hypothetical protein